MGRGAGVWLRRLLLVECGVSCRHAAGHVLARNHDQLVAGSLLGPGMRLFSTWRSSTYHSKDADVKTEARFLNIQLNYVQITLNVVIQANYLVICILVFS